MCQENVRNGFWVITGFLKVFFNVIIVDIPHVKANGIPAIGVDEKISILAVANGKDILIYFTCRERVKQLTRYRTRYVIAPDIDEI
jgi:hypothetical protein